MNPRTEVLRGLHSLPYDLLTWPATPNARLNVVMIPGNPGLAQYYTAFCTQLSILLPFANIYAIGHLGHCTSASSRLSILRSTPASLAEQIEHKVAFVDSLADNDANDTPIIVIGHSIGAHIASQVLRQRRARVVSAHMLFPTISDMAQTPNGRRLWPLFSPYAAVPVAASTSLLSFVPKRALDRLVGLLAGQEGAGAKVTASLVASPATVAAALYMARLEMDQVQAVDRELLERDGAAMRWYWARGDTDGWVLPSSIDEIERLLDEAGHPKSKRVRCEEGMQHAFVLNTNHCHSLAAKCAGWIQEDVQQATMR